MDEIFRQVPSREIPDMARLDDGRDGGTEESEGYGRDETGMAHDTRPSLAHPRSSECPWKSVIINNPSSLSNHCYTLFS